jgi:hypothetical protein
MQIIDVEQNTPDWLEMRLGSIGGSSITDVLARPPKTGRSKSWKKLLWKKAAEVTAGAVEQNTPPALQALFDRGHKYEKEAIDHYAWETGQNMQRVGIVLSDIPGVHYSPDGLTDDGVIEVKVRLPHVFIELSEENTTEIQYRRQCQMGMWVCEKKWADLVDYCPEKHWMRVTRFERDEAMIDQIDIKLGEFRKELAVLVEKYK